MWPSRVLTEILSCRQNQILPAFAAELATTRLGESERFHIYYVYNLSLLPVLWRPRDIYTSRSVMIQRMRRHDYPAHTLPQCWWNVGWVVTFNLLADVMRLALSHFADTHFTLNVPESCSLRETLGGGGGGHMPGARLV